MWIGVLWAGLRVAMWITHVGGKLRHGMLEKSLNQCDFIASNKFAEDTAMTGKLKKSQKSSLVRKRLTR